MQLAFDLDLPETLPALPALPAVDRYVAHTADTTPEEARAAFLARYGVEPAEVKPGLGGLLLAGPLPADVDFQTRKELRP